MGLEREGVGRSEEEWTLRGTEVGWKHEVREKKRMERERER